MPPSIRPSSRAVTWRSVSVGMIGVLYLCGLSPYNDFIVNNTLLVGNFLPVGMLLFFLVVVALINAPLLRFAPRLALNRYELIVAMSMTLISCGIPGAGLMRYLPSQLVGLWNEGSMSWDYAQMLNKLDLPAWMFPSVGKDTYERAFDPTTINYFRRVPGVEDSFAAHWNAVPWSAWLRPTIVWGYFSLTLIGAFTCMVFIVRRQWVDNERLPFPLATVYASIIEPPEPGRAFNSLFHSRMFWIAFVGVFLVHSLNALNAYQSRYFPEVPLRYDFSAIFGDEPWVFMTGDFKSATLYFSVIGICYFLPLQISMSIWFFFAAFQVALMVAGSTRSSFTGAMQADQFFGALTPYAIALIWVGRSHWALVLRQMIRGWREGEPAGRYVPYSLAGWGLLLFFSMGVSFMLWAGASVVGAVTCMVAIHTIHLCVARIVAETGMPFVNFYGNLDRPWLYLIDTHGEGIRTTLRSYFLTQMLGSIYAADVRESPMVFTSHAYRLGDEVYPEPPQDNPNTWRRTIPFILCLTSALIVGFFAAGAAKLYTEYNYAVTLDAKAELPDPHGNSVAIRENTLYRSWAYSTETGPREAHSRVGHLFIGGGVSLFLLLMRLKYVNFPFHPIGFLLAYTWPVSKIWFSMAIGWLVKLLLTRLGGIGLYRRCRPVFIGLILGEASATGVWLVVSLVLNQMGLPYKSMLFMPP